ncbi:hypothetical protein MHYP_G00041960 [Metynnis hypsauchen]
MSESSSRPDVESNGEQLSSVTRISSDEVRIPQRKTSGGSVVLLPLFLSFKLISATKCPSPCGHEWSMPSCSSHPWRRS